MKRKTPKKRRKMFPRKWLEDAYIYPLPRGIQPDGWIVGRDLSEPGKSEWTTYTQVAHHRGRFYVLRTLEVIDGGLS